MSTKAMEIEKNTPKEMEVRAQPGGDVAPYWRVSAGRVLTLDRPRVLAILNLTPDSFSDGGSLTTVDRAINAAERAVDEGADMLDLGGESTRPGAMRVPPKEQIQRVLPALASIRAKLPDVPISIDTTSALMARAALDAGADAINDVSAGLEDEQMLPLAGERGAGLILMHRRGPPGEDCYSDRYVAPPEYEDVVGEVAAFLRSRAQAAQAAGVARESIILDPGLGFGKTVEQNLELVRGTARLLELGHPIMSAASRKSFVGRISLHRDSEPCERLAGSIAVSVAHFLAGARLFRVHDIGPQVQALRAIAALLFPNTTQTK